MSGARHVYHPGSALPPPPPLVSSPSSLNAYPAVQQSPLRRIAAQQPPSIHTAVGAQHRTFLHPSTPASAFPAGTPLSPYASSNLSSASTLPSASSRGSHSPTNLRSASSAMAYNPQEWGRHGPTGGGAFMAHAATPQVNVRPDSLTGMEAALPSPPPPYSPQPHQSMSNAMHSSPQTTSSPFAQHHAAPPQPEYASSAASSSRTTHTASSGYSAEPSRAMSTANTPQMNSVPSFAPPPGRDRSASRSRTHFLGGLSFSRNRGQEQATGSPSAIETLRHNTTEALSRTPEPAVRRTPPNMEPSPIYTPEAIRPPAARRAASTGAIGLAGPSRRPSGTESPATQWGSAMPLPPPPPGPPPSGSRSQSMTRTPEYSQASSSGAVPPPPPPTRRPAQTGTSLGPVPPTPADWVDEDAAPHARSPAARGLRLNTNPTVNESQWQSSIRGESSSSAANRVAEPHTAHPTSGLTRGGARREPSALGIRERRSESRAARERSVEPQTAIEQSNNPWARDMNTAAKPADLVLNAPAGAISRRRTITKNTPRSAGRSMTSPADPPHSAASRRLAAIEVDGISSNHSTPRTFDEGHQVMSPDSYVPTPPFSPTAQGKAPVGRGLSNVPPKALPTPPPQRSDGNLGSSLGVPTSAKDRPVSHILHVPNDDVSMHAPLSPARPPSAGVSQQTPKPSEAELFAKGSIDRHRQFVEKEMAAGSDQERLELFAEFIVAESRLRRDQYSSAFDTMASEIFDLTRDMWRSYNTTGRRSATPNQSNATSISKATDRTIETHITAPSPTPSKSGFSTQSAPESPASVGSQHSARGENPQFSGFKPCLSPIPSMAMSTIPDEEASRGRSASRWWEGSADGASAGRGGNKIERTKRESKYMGLPKEYREYLQYDGESTPPYSGTPGPAMDYSNLGPNEYPSEKVGIHDQQPPSSAHSYSFFAQSAPVTPDPYKLDVSRLVTLPPPYPRHHPAVNNNHPDLSSLRNMYRTIGEFETVAPIKEDFNSKMEADRDQERASVAERRSHLRFDIQEQIRSGHMSFADAAKAEADFETAEVQRSQRAAKQEFEAYKKEVHGPLNALFAERITKATASIDHIASGLRADAEDPNRIQEEGDEQPELLEKLTLLKWLFELREQLHRETFEIESERDHHYKNVILTPYILVNNKEKVADVENFFTKDHQERKAGLEKEALKRFEEFMAVVERYVTGGVEDQISAFWDIAPNLLAVVQKVPRDLDELQILIPPQEYDENPSYFDFPAQYLFTLLNHAKKSSYQFIESQINLLCLLHEVKTGVMTANTRLLETQRYMAGEAYTSVEREMRAIRQDEEARLTLDLKEKVSVVEGQWEEGFGNGVDQCKERVEQYLMERGGWDESLQE